MTNSSLLITFPLNHWSSPILYIIKAFTIKKEYSLKPVIILSKKEKYLATLSFSYLINALILQLLINFVVGEFF